MKHWKVTVFDLDTLVYKEVVKSKRSTLAVANVMNKIANKGFNISKVKVIEVSLEFVDIQRPIPPVELPEVNPEWNNNSTGSILNVEDLPRLPIGRERE